MVYARQPYKIIIEIIESMQYLDHSDSGLKCDFKAFHDGMSAGICIHDCERGLRDVAFISANSIMSNETRFSKVLEPLFWWIKLVDAFEGRRPIVWC